MTQIFFTHPMLTQEKPILDIVNQDAKKIPTPFYLIDENRLVKNLERIKTLGEKSGAKSVLALKCFSTWAVFDLMKKYLDGTTSSSLYEARLGHEKFGKEVQAYSVAYSDSDIQEIKTFATKVIFNSISQLDRYQKEVQRLPIGLRINPGVSYSGFDLADPARRQCRLGESDVERVKAVASRISGAMFHCNCENADFDAFSKMLDTISEKYGSLMKNWDWVSLGGGIYFTLDDYPLIQLAERLKRFSTEFGVQVYLEPGESAITSAGFLATSVLDLVKNEVDIAIVDAAVEAHMLDLLIYSTPAKMEDQPKEGFTYQVAGKTCLAGDIFGTYSFPKKLAVGDRVVFSDAAGYTMVKRNWFNGVQAPAIAVRRLDGKIDLVRSFGYEDFKSQLS